MSNMTPLYRSSARFVVVATLLGLFVSAVNGQTSVPIPEIQHLRLDGVFEIGSDPDVRIRQMIGHADILYFLKRTREGGQFVETTADGQILRLLDIPGNTTEFLINENRTVFALRKSRSPQARRQVLRISEGRIQDTQEISRPKATGFGLLAGEVVVWEGGILFRSAGPTGGINTPIADPYLVATLPGGRMAVVNTHKPRLWVVGTDGAVVDRGALRAPEVSLSDDSSHGNVKQIRIISLATDRNGNLFCLVSPYRPADGAVILQFDDSGTLKRRFRAELPLSTLRTIVADEHLLASHLAIVKNRLVLGSVNENRCAHYELPRLSE